MQLVKERPPKKTGIPDEGLFLLVGYTKTGKTRFAASFPDSYVLELEKGRADRLPGRIHEINTLTDFREAIKAVLAEPSIKTVIIDSIDILSDWIELEVAKSFGLDNISQQKKNVSGFDVWAAYRQKMDQLVAYLKASGKFIIIIAHCKEPKTDEAGSIISPAGINVPGKSGPFLAAQSEMIGYTYKKVVGSKTEYSLTFQGGPGGSWGSAVDELNDQTIKLPKENGFSAYAAMFKKEKKK